MAYTTNPAALRCDKNAWEVIVEFGSRYTLPLIISVLRLTARSVDNNLGQKQRHDDRTDRQSDIDQIDHFHIFSQDLG